VYKLIGKYHIAVSLFGHKLIMLMQWARVFLVLNYWPQINLQHVLISTSVLKFWSKLTAVYFDIFYMPFKHSCFCILIAHSTYWQTIHSHTIYLHAIHSYTTYLHAKQCCEHLHVMKTFKLYFFQYICIIYWCILYIRIRYMYLLCIYELYIFMYSPY